jgi:hypothetical protein
MHMILGLNMNALRKEFVIVGGGAVGVGLALALEKQLARAQSAAQAAGHNAPHCIVTVVDSRDFAGAGTPYWDHDYGCDSKIYLNNQPNERMLLSTEDRFAYADYLAQRSGGDAGALRYKFSSRVEFGSFINDQLRQAIRRSAGGTVQIRHQQAEALGVHGLENGQLRVRLQSNQVQQIDADVVLAATGHQRNGVFNAHKDHAGFFESPSCIAELHRHLDSQAEKGNTDIALIGGGQASIDSIAAIDRGSPPWRRIHVYGALTPAYWPFHPEQHPVELDEVEFVPAILTAETVLARNAFDLESLKSLLAAEVAHAKTHPAARINGRDLHFGPGHIYGKLNTGALAHIFETRDKGRVLAEFETHVRTLFSNPTPPGRYDMLANRQELTSFQRALINPGQISYGSDGSSILTLPQQEPKRFAAILAACTLARSAFTNASNPDTVYSPFLRDLHRHNHLRINAAETGHFAAGEQKLSGLFLAHGPATRPVWGIEGFTVANEELARDIAHQEILACNAA